MKQKTLLDKYKAIQKIGRQVELPWQVARVWNVKTISVFGDDVCIGGSDADYCSILEARAALEFVVNQLGGETKWSDLE